MTLRCTSPIMETYMSNISARRWVTTGDSIPWERLSGCADHDWVCALMPRTALMKYWMQLGWLRVFIAVWAARSLHLILQEDLTHFNYAWYLSRQEIYVRGRFQLILSTWMFCSTKTEVQHIFYIDYTTILKGIYWAAIEKETEIYICRSPAFSNHLVAQYLNHASPGWLWPQIHNLTEQKVV